MRILIDTGDYLGSNLGDAAMLQVTVNRLQALFPQAALEVMTEDPAALARHCPQVKPVANQGRHLWFSNRVLLGRYHQSLPMAISLALSHFKQLFGRHAPRILSWLMQLRLGLNNERARSVHSFVNALVHADLVVITGAGGFTDHSRAWNLDVLDILAFAQSRHIPTVMFGQGMGPLYDNETRYRARTILPQVDLIALRERRTAVPLVESLGVPETKTMITGDDAVELAYQVRRQELGKALGVNLRVASYAAIQNDIIDTIRPILHRFAQRHQIELLPVPIALHAAINDVGTIRQLLDGQNGVADGGEQISTTLELIAQIARCRVVVTGAYHASVLALSQGVPVVCLSKSEYYTNKYLGIAELFGAGCEIVFMQSTTFADDLVAALERMWVIADEVRPTLLAAAATQIDAGWEAYRRAAMLVNSRDRDFS